ncbi:MAG: AAA family ATPase, partial [Kamptonema sp. SIO4C4]|nr:AAA family ATPase [Kamptonema sp. SIO4C4]
TSDSELAYWQSKILAAVGENGQVLIDVIPELEQIIGPQPPAPELSGNAAQKRFHLLFGKFVRVFTTPKHPLTVFLDDLQWADLASLDLLQLLLEESVERYLLLLGAYRDNEVSPTHPLMLKLAEMQKEGLTVNTLTLAPLSEMDITRLVADTLLCAFDNATLLSQLVYQKTQGNPFFTTQFLKGLQENGYITFNRDAGYWECDLTAVRELVLTDDVVAFIAQKLQKLPPETQQVLKLAACVGNQFDLKTLAIIAQTAVTDTAEALWDALQEGLIAPQSEVYKFYLSNQENPPQQADDLENTTYRFLHDRIQQAAYSLIPDNELQATHYHIGKLLLDYSSQDEQEERLFAIVSHLNASHDLMSVGVRGSVGMLAPCGYLGMSGLGG